MSRPVCQDLQPRGAPFVALLHFAWVGSMRGGGWRAAHFSVSAGTEFCACGFGTITPKKRLHGSENAGTEFCACRYGTMREVFGGTGSRFARNRRGRAAWEPRRPASPRAARPCALATPFRRGRAHWSPPSARTAPLERPSRCARPHRAPLPALRTARYERPLQCARPHRAPPSSARGMRSARARAGWGRSWADAGPARARLTSARLPYVVGTKP